MLPSGYTRVAIVGAGYSGALTAVQLARHARFPLEVVLIEQSGRFGAGVAYGTESPRHMLNVPAAGMSALPDSPDDFLRWSALTGLRLTPGSFVPRMLYRQYLQHVLGRETGASRARFLLTKIAARVVDVEGVQGRFCVRLQDGRELDADCVVLAPGNFPPARLPVFDALRDTPAYVGDPWSCLALEGLSADDALLFVGTGLTTVDLVMDLRERGHRGKLHAVSRRGLLNRAHRAELDVRAPGGVLDAERLPATALGLTREVRRLVREAEAAGNDWHEVVLALRPLTTELWQRLEPRERRRFLARLRPFWDVHRHLLPPEVAAQLAELRRTGALQVLAGRVLACRPHPGGVRVRVGPRGSATALELDVARVINCTGPERSVAGGGSPLLARLERRGMLRLDPLGLGLSTDPEGVVLDARGTPLTRLYLIGPLRQGELWECVAVPELRVLAQELAVHALASCAALARVTQG